MRQEVRAIAYDKWQQEVLEAKGNILLCTGRQVGKTTTFAAKAAIRMMKQPGCRIIVGSLTEDQAQLIIIMTLSYLEQHNKTWISKGNKKPTKSKIQLTNGSSMLARPVGIAGDAFRGFTGDVLIADEGSRMPELMWAAAKPTLLTTGGEIWMCSTPFGKQGYFYECFLNKNKRFTVFHINSEEVIQNRPVSDVWTKERREGAMRLLEEEKKDMTTLQYAQEFLAMFVDDLRQFFPDDVIAKCCILPRSKSTSFSSSYSYFLGVDIARMGEDEGTFEILEKRDNEYLKQIDNIITKKKLTTETHDRILELDSIYHFKKIGIDAGSGSLGVGILDWLLRETNLRRRVVALNAQSRMMDYQGEKKKSLQKEDMYQNLLALMERGMIKLLDDTEIIASLKSVQYEYIKTSKNTTLVKIFGNYTHIAEGLIRAAWLANQKHINMSIRWF